MALVPGAETVMVHWLIHDGNCVRYFDFSDKFPGGTFKFRKMRDFAACRQIDAGDFTSRPLYFRAAARVAILFAPAL